MSRPLSALQRKTLYRALTLMLAGVSKADRMVAHEAAAQARRDARARSRKAAREVARNG